MKSVYKQEKTKSVKTQEKMKGVQKQEKNEKCVETGEKCKRKVSRNRKTSLEIKEMTGKKCLEIGKIQIFPSELSVKGAKRGIYIRIYCEQLLHS